MAARSRVGDEICVEEEVVEEEGVALLMWGP